MTTELDVTLDESAATLLRDMLGDDEESAMAIRLVVGNGQSGHGLYVAQEENQMEGAFFLCPVNSEFAT